MDIDSSENRNVVAGAKPDSQSNGGNNVTTSKIPSVNDDKTDLIEDNCDQHKLDNIGEEDIDRKSPSNSDGTILSHQVPKSEFPFRDTSSITESNNQIRDMSTATESNTSVAPEIKQEGSCSPPDAPLPSYAISKIQVSCRYYIITKTIFIYFNSNHWPNN